MAGYKITKKMNTTLMKHRNIMIANYADFMIHRTLSEDSW